MAKQRHGINDAYRGTVGTVIGYEWRGKWCLRARPRRVRNPRTEKQQLNRQLFKQMVQLAGALKVVLRVGLRQESLRQHMTECNLFVRLNKGSLTVPPLGMDMQVDWPDIVVSDGAVLTPEFTEVQTGGDMVEFRFGGEGGGDDEVYLAAYCPELQATAMSAGTARRTGRVAITLPEAWHGREVHLWGFATDYKGGASVSVYLGTATADDVVGELGELGEAGGGFRPTPTPSGSPLPGGDGCRGLRSIPSREGQGWVNSHNSPNSPTDNNDSPTDKETSPTDKAAPPSAEKSPFFDLPYNIFAAPPLYNEKLYSYGKQQSQREEPETQHQPRGGQGHL